MSIIGNVANASPIEGSQSSQAKAKLEDDLNQFLNLLVAQLQNQDPLDPLDANEFTSQLVQFASVEQQIFQNSNLEKLLNLQETSQISQMVDFINNRTLDPVVMYMFEFTYELDQDDLSYIWQNLAPRNYKKISKQTATVSHDLANNELLTRENLHDNPNLRWMVFKVKQKGQIRSVARSGGINIGSIEEVFCKNLRC